MREILFRGKRKDNGEWVYWNIYGEFCTLECERAKLTRKAANGEVNLYYIYDYLIDLETIEQYTGLTDKNGKKIFEGDILNTTNSNCAIWYVDYKNTAFCCNQGNVNYSCVLDEFMQFSVVEVIGNIHDNPELLKGGEEE